MLIIGGKGGGGRGGLYGLDGGQMWSLMPYDNYCNLFKYHRLVFEHKH